MRGQYILDAQGNPVEEPDIIKWAQWYETGNRRVGWTELPDGRVVSTVFLGIDHSWRGGPPVLWETMVQSGGDWDNQSRYTSLEDAKKGHAETVNRLMKELEAQP